MNARTRRRGAPTATAKARNPQPYRSEEMSDRDGLDRNDLGAILLIIGFIVLALLA